MRYIDIHDAVSKNNDKAYALLDHAETEMRLLNLTGGIMRKLLVLEEQAIKLYVIEEYTYEEIGEIMNVSSSRINQILNKSLRRLRKNKEFIIGIK